jgi:hypothetical protein
MLSHFLKQKWAGSIALVPDGVPIVPSERIVFWIITIYQNFAEVHNALHRNFGGMTLTRHTKHAIDERFDA